MQTFAYKIMTNLKLSDNARININYEEQWQIQFCRKLWYYEADVTDKEHKAPDYNKSVLITQLSTTGFKKFENPKTLWPSRIFNLLNMEGHCE